MSDQTSYTPSLDEAREHFAHVRGWRIDPEARRRHEDREAMFDRLIAQVRAETLREAAKGVHPFAPDQGGRDHKVTRGDVYDWLLERADRIEQGETDD